MRFEIFDGKPEQQVTRLKLERSWDGGVSLVVVDSTGNSVIQGFLLGITNDGRIYRHADVNKGLGFALDGHGRVELYDE